MEQLLPNALLPHTNTCKTSKSKCFLLSSMKVQVI